MAAVTPPLPTFQPPLKCGYHSSSRSDEHAAIPRHIGSIRLHRCPPAGQWDEKSGQDDLNPLH